jgi:hypothetical protein
MVHGAEVFLNKDKAAGMGIVGILIQIVPKGKVLLPGIDTQFRRGRCIERIRERAFGIRAVNNGGNFIEGAHTVTACGKVLYPRKGTYGRGCIVEGVSFRFGPCPRGRFLIPVKAFHKKGRFQGVHSIVD